MSVRLFRFQYRLDNNLLKNSFGTINSVPRLFRSIGLYTALFIDSHSYCSFAGMQIKATVIWANWFHILRSSVNVNGRLEKLSHKTAYKDKSKCRGGTLYGISRILLGTFWKTSTWKTEEMKG
jgi:hypothetical protein